MFKIGDKVSYALMVNKNKVDILGVVTKVGISTITVSVSDMHPSASITVHFGQVVLCN